MLTNYLKPDLNQKLRIPIHTLEKNSVNSRFLTDINKLLLHVQQDCGPQLKIINKIDVQREISNSPQQYKKPIGEINYIIPMHKMQCLEVQQKMEHELRIKDKQLQLQYRSKGLVKMMPVLLKGGFPFDVVKKHKINREIHDSFNTINNQSITDPNSNSKFMHDIFSQSNDDSTRDLNYTESASKRSPNKNILFQVQDRKNVQLPYIYSSIVKRGNKFSMTERNDESICISPGPAKYELKRFGECNQISKNVMDNKEEKIPQSKFISYLRKKSLTFLPEIKGVLSESVEPKLKAGYVCDPNVDKYGRQLFPLTQNDRSFPGPADYHQDLTCITKRVQKIKEDKLIREEIQNWLSQQVNQSK